MKSKGFYEKDILGEKVPSNVKKVKPEGGIEKTVYFSSLILKDSMAQINIEGTMKNISMDNALEESFNKTNQNFVKDGPEEYFTFTCDGKNYVLSLIEYVKGKEFFGRISTEQEYKDVLQQFIAENAKGKKKRVFFEEIIINSFTFFYINISKKSMAYIGHQKLKSINKILQKYFEHYSKNSAPTIRIYAQNNLLEQLKGYNKLQEITAQVVPDKVVYKSLSETMGWDMNISNFSLQVKVTGMTKNQVEKLAEKKSKTKTISSPRLAFLDRYHNSVVIDLFEETFSVKEFIQLTDPNDYSGIKNKLKEADKKYII